jgi:uncharacterized protein (UPF0335 family)
MSGLLLAGPRVARIRTFRLRGTNRLAVLSFLDVVALLIAAPITARGDSATRLSAKARRPRAAPQPEIMECELAEGSVAADELRLLIERIERLEEEKKAIGDDVRDVYAEAKARGYDPKTMRAIVRLRKMEKNDRDEAEALLETYKAALGLA